MRAWTVVLARIILAGCYTTYPGIGNDAQRDQPLTARGVPAAARVSMIGGKFPNIYYIEDYLEWRLSNSVWIDSRKVTARCDAFLDDFGGYWARTEVPVHSLTHSKGTVHRRPDALVPVVPDAWVIVSLEPVVVVRGPGAVEVREYQLRQWLEREGDEAGNDHIMLDRGYVYGTRVPYSSDPVWFSPDTREGPRSADHVSDAERTIPVPWGWLVLRRAGDEWVVRATVD